MREERERKREKENVCVREREREREIERMCERESDRGERSENNVINTPESTYNIRLNPLKISLNYCRNLSKRY